MDHLELIEKINNQHHEERMSSIELMQVMVSKIADLEAENLKLKSMIPKGPTI